MEASLQALLSSFCAQDPSRSYAPGGDAFPVCARCLGVYVGLFAGLLWWIAARPSGRLSLGLAIFVLLAFLQMAVLGFGAIYGRIDLPADARCASGGLFGGAAVLGLSSFARGERRAGWSIVPLFLLSVGAPLALGHWGTPVVAGFVAALGACGGVFAANLALLSGRFPLRVASFLSSLVLLAGEVFALHAWRTLWRG